MLSLVGAVSVTALTINYANVVTGWLQPWLWVNPTLAAFLVFWGLFLTLILVVHLVFRRVTDVVKWERIHWSIQGIGLLLGGLRGLWWSGLILVALSASGFTYLRESVETHSILGPRLLDISRESLGRIADRFPGADQRGKVLIPAAKPTST